MCRYLCIGRKPHKLKYNRLDVGEDLIGEVSIIGETPQRNNLVQYLSCLLGGI